MLPGVELYVDAVGPVADAECSVMLVEPAGLLNTGDSEKSDYTTSGIWFENDNPASN